MGNLRRTLRDLMPGAVRERYHRYALRRDFGIDRGSGVRRPTRIDDHRPAGLNIVGYWDSPSGVGESARSIERAAAAAGVPTARVDVPDRSRATASSREARYDVNLYHVNADGAAGAVEELGPALHGGRANVGYWYWETESFPEKWIDRFDYFDEIWVATEFCRAAIERVSPVPVALVPPAVGMESVPAARTSRGLPATGLFFLTIADVSSGIERKNPAATIRAFARAFGGSTEAFLLALCRNAERSPGLLEELRRAAEGARVIVLERTLPRPELDGLLSACDAYVSLHRAEGFGFPIAEAMSLGKPVVATDFSGNRDYLDQSTGYPVRWSPWSLPAAAGPYPEGTRWADPDEAHASELIRSIAADRKAAAARGEAAKERIRSLYAPEVSGCRLAERMKQLRSRLRSRA